MTLGVLIYNYEDVQCISYWKRLRREIELIVQSHLFFQGWTNETVEYEMDLIEAAVKSLRSLAKESRER